MRNNHKYYTATVLSCRPVRSRRTTPKRQPTYLQDPEDNKQIVRLPLAGEGGNALINREDFDRLVDELGLSTNWTLNMGQVRAPLNSTKGHLIGVARALLGAGAKQYVAYVNGDRTDLRRKNLMLKRGSRAKRTDAALLLARVNRGSKTTATVREPLAA